MERWESEAKLSKAATGHFTLKMLMLSKRSGTLSDLL